MPARVAHGRMCHKSHNFAAPLDYFHEPAISGFENRFAQSITRDCISRDAAFTVWNVDMKALKIAGVVLAALIAVLAALLMIGIPSGFVTSAIEARLERETGYRIVIAGATRLGVLPSLSVTAPERT